MPKHLGVLIISCICSLGVYAQPKSALELIEEATKHTNEPLYANLLLQVDSIAIVQKDTRSRAIANEKLGFYFFSRDADKCIRHYDLAFKLYKTSGNEKKAAFCRQNIAFAYDEAKHDNAEALEAAKDALRLWQLQQDTMQQANIHKYIGLLQGRLGQYAKANESIDKAIVLFGIKNFDRGIAVSRFDLANILLEQKDAAGAVMELQKAKTIWQQYQDYARIYDINTGLLKSFVLAGNKQAAKQALEENLRIEQLANIFWSNRLDFYRAAQIYAYPDKEKVQDFTMKYSTLKDSLTKEGIKTQ